MNKNKKFVKDMVKEEIIHVVGHNKAPEELGYVNVPVDCHDCHKQCFVSGSGFLMGDEKMSDNEAEKTIDKIRKKEVVYLCEDCFIERMEKGKIKINKEKMKNFGLFKT
jgi:hypothetical protein